MVSNSCNKIISSKFTPTIKSDQLLPALNNYSNNPFILYTTKQA